MRRFSELDPRTTAIFFFGVTGIAMFSTYPLVTAVTLISGILLKIVLKPNKNFFIHMFLLFVILSLANPLVSHNGITVLFVMNDNPVTLEALLYGTNSSAKIIGVICWFSCFTSIMTSEKLLFLTGMLSPKLSLVLSMAVRFIPLLKKQTEKVRNTQKAMGLFNDDNMIDDIRGNARILSIVATWSLENGIITADSMSARGFGTGKRTVFSDFRLTRFDKYIIVLNILLLVVFALTSKKLIFVFYPSLRAEIPDIYGISGIISYSVLSFLPLVIEKEADLKWKYLQSKI